MHVADCAEVAVLALSGSGMLVLVQQTLVNLQTAGDLCHAN